MESLEDRLAPAVTIVFDYSRDFNNFFSTNTVARDTLEQAAVDLTSKLQDTLSAITPGGGNTWMLNAFDPTNPGNNFQVSNRTIAADTLIVYAGATPNLGGALGIGGPGGYSGFGNSAWLDTLAGRGEPGALADPATDFAPWGGSITFDSDFNRWHFGTTTVGLDANEVDFYSVAQHELGHLLGFGTADSFDTFRSGLSFTGANAVALFGGNVPLSDDSHWQDGLLFNGDPTTMDPVAANGVRTAFTDLDYAALDDLGWEVDMDLASVVVTGTNTPTPTFTWQAITGADSYDLQVDNLTTGQQEIIRVEVAGTSFTALTPLANGNYRARVAGLDGGVNMGWGPYQSFTINVPPPAVPTGLAVTNTTIATHTPTFSWNAAAGADHYDLWVNNVSTGQSEVIRNMNIAGTSFTPAVGLPNGNYRAWVRSISATGVASAWSAAVNFTENATPAAPTGLNAAVTNQAPNFTWNAVVGAARYDLWVNNLTTGASQVIRQQNLLGTSFAAAALPAGNYRFWVRAVDAFGGISAFSTQRDFAVPPLGVPALTITPATALTRAPTFNWTTVAGAARYDIWVNNLTTGVSQVVRQQNLTGNSFTPPPLAGANYRVWIRAIDSAGNASAFSVPQQFTVPAMGVPVLTVTGGTPAVPSVTFNWNAVTAAVRYDLWVNNVSTGQSQVIRLTNLTGTSHIAALPNGNYRAWIRAIDAGNNISAFSVATNFTVAI